ncbi:hypothetical protein [Rivularia sp. UHCC 0363]|uniref:hypothetical protein n=1 Tax=Rivularia sp. UHCC 0363 TaxID=3110244 RepID=UPI002B212864|nr:hypothetical protein [Rivularia sp. UHCC 0363]MEA5596362.1 hypothetical protein [Rivularia sp. UHCC 0363]
MATSLEGSIGYDADLVAVATGMQGVDKKSLSANISQKNLVSLRGLIATSMSAIYCVMSNFLTIISKDLNCIYT